MMASLDSQSHRQVSLTDTGRSEENHILMLGDKREIKELHDRPFIQVRMEREIILLNGFCSGQTSSFQGGLHPSTVFGGDLFFQQVIQEG